MRLAITSSLISILSLGAIGCVDPAEQELDSEVTVPPRGAADTLDVGEWNIEWFGSTGNGPTNEALQLANVRDVIAGADLDLWGLEEIVSATQLGQLESQLTGYDTVLASDPSVASGSTYYSSGEQKVGILFKSSVVTVRAARLILTANDPDFAGRPPLEVEITATIDGVARDLVVIVFHAKAFDDLTSYNRRLAASSALKAYLDGSRPNDRVIVLGDYNDDLDTSITSGQPSPYQNFVDDTARYATPTKAFSDANQPTTAGYPDAIDHHMLTNELASLYVASSAEVYRVDAFIPSYSSTTSDHFPTITHYKLAATPPKVIINEILANEPGSATAGEFIELVNIGGADANLGGSTISDSIGVRHVFAAGTTIAPGKALVVYGGASAIPGGFPAVAASTGALGLNNTTDTVTLRDAAGTQIDGFAYPAPLSAVDGVSMNRSPDADPTGAFVLHTQLTSDPASPGSRVKIGPF